MNKKRDYIFRVQCNSIRTVFVVFLVVLGVIALSKVSTSSIDYTAIFLLSVLTHLKVKKQK